jgi:hypothetical protein
MRRQLTRAPELEEVPIPIVGGLDIHRKQITFDYLETVTGQVQRGQISPADREHLRAWLGRFARCEDAAFAVEGCTRSSEARLELVFEPMDDMSAQ